MWGLEPRPSLTGWKQRCADVAAAFRQRVQDLGVGDDSVGAILPRGGGPGLERDFLKWGVSMSFFVCMDMRNRAGRPVALCR